MACQRPRVTVTGHSALCAGQTVSERKPLRRLILEEASRRRRLAIVLPLLIRKAVGGHLSISALQHQLRLCGVHPSEKYLSSVLVRDWEATRGRRMNRATMRRSVVWRGVAFRGGGVLRARKALAAEFEAVLKEAGMPDEPYAQPSWRNMSPTALYWLTSGRGSAFGAQTDDGPEGTDGLVRRGKHTMVRLPSDEHNPNMSVEARARNYLSDALAAGPYNHALEELYWRGDWRGYPPWHKKLLWSHLDTGGSVMQWARDNAVSYLEAKRALQTHRVRAGLRPGD